MIVQGLNAIVGFVTRFFDLLATLFGWLLDGILFVLKGAMFFVFDGVLTFLEGILATINLTSSATDYAAAWVGLPPQLIYCVRQCGLAAGVALVCAAIVIRMLLNLIPGALTRI